MFVRDSMTKKVEVAKPDMTLLEVARKMRDGNFGSLPVAENDRMIGMITDRDLAIRGIAEGRDPKKSVAKEVMSSGVFYCYDDQTLDEVARNMGDVQVRRLPVVNREKRLVGILSLGDLAQSEPEHSDKALPRISEKQNRRPSRKPQSLGQGVY